MTGPNPGCPICAGSGWDYIGRPCRRCVTEKKDQPVVHAMFDKETGILPCCGLHKYEARQDDKVSLGDTHPVTCDGTKRYRRGAVRH